MYHSATVTPRGILDATGQLAVDHGGMGWLVRHWRGMLAAVVVGALVYAAAVSLTLTPSGGPVENPGFTNHDLARALGDSGDLFAPPWITCRIRSGRVDSRTFNRRCLRRDVYGLCSPGTGETRTVIFVNVHGRRYDVVDERVVWVAPPCASVA